MTTPQDPVNPDYTDHEATAGTAPQAAGAEELDPTLEADLAEALADVSPADAHSDAAEGAAEDGASASAGEESAEDSLQAQLAERTEDLQRLNAEYSNYRRRTERERGAAAELAKAKVLGEFLPILDDLDLARQHGDLEAGPLKSIADKLTDVLTKHDLKPFGAEGDAFDPEVHEAVQDLSSGEEQVLGTVLRRGYTVGDRVVRTAMVIIADPAGAAAEPADGTASDAGHDPAAGEEPAAN